MFNRSDEDVFQDLDLLIENVNNHGVDKLKNEIEARKKRSSIVLGNNDFFMEQFAGKIAFSQNANSNSVSEMIEAGVLRDAFQNFDTGVVVSLSSDKIIEEYWGRLGVIRFPGKIPRIIGCALALETIENNGESMKELLKNIPKEVNNVADLDNFWTEFTILKNKLKEYKMPFFKQTTSLLHLLVDLGFYCLKPDLVVMKVASQGLGLTQYKKSYYPDKELVKVVRAIQTYSLEKGLRPEVLDLYLLIEGGQSWAKKKQFVTRDFQPRFGPYRK